MQIKTETFINQSLAEIAEARLRASGFTLVIVTSVKQLRPYEYTKSKAGGSPSHFEGDGTITLTWID